MFQQRRHQAPLRRSYVPSCSTAYGFFASSGRPDGAGPRRATPPAIDSSPTSKNGRVTRAELVVAAEDRNGIRRARAPRRPAARRRRPRRSSTQPAARAFFTQFRSPYGATSQRSPPSSTIETGVDQGLPVLRPGTVRRCVRGPVSPSRASGRTSGVERRAAKALPIRLRARSTTRSKPPTRSRPPSSAGRPGARSRVTRDQWASGRMRVERSARKRPSASRMPSPNPIPICGHSSSRPEFDRRVGVGRSRLRGLDPKRSSTDGRRSSDSRSGTPAEAFALLDERCAHGDERRTTESAASRSRPRRMRASQVER